MFWVERIFDEKGRGYDIDIRSPNWYPETLIHYMPAKIDAINAIRGFEY